MGEATPIRAANGPGKGPARGYSWAPFAPGHTQSLKHGVWSRFALAEADELAEQVVGACPHLAESDAFAVRDWSIAQVRVWRLEAWLAEHGDLRPDGEPQPAVVELRHWLKAAAAARSRLGFDPLSRVALGLAGLEGVRREQALETEARAAGDLMRRRLHDLDTEADDE